MKLQRVGLLCIALAALISHTAAAAAGAASEPVAAFPAAAKMPMTQLAMEGPTLEMLARGYRGLASPALRNWRRLAMKLKTPGVYAGGIVEGCSETHISKGLHQENHLNIHNSIGSSQLRPPSN
jgi:hypothetical protein